MIKRIVFGSIMIAVLAGLLYLDWRIDQSLEGRDAADSPLYRLPTVGILLMLLCAGYFEVGRLAKGAGMGLLKVSGLVGVALISTFDYWQTFGRRWLWPGMTDNALVLLVLASAILMAIFLEQMIRHRIEGAFKRIAATTLAVAYLGIGGALIFHIRGFGIPMLTLFLVATKGMDIGAYFSGSFFGRHKLIPWLSPGKTWEGLIGGTIITAVLSVLLAKALGISFGECLCPLALWPVAIFGAVVGLVGQFGDLCESLLKRSAQIKDSGALVPEFGGVLDIIDSPLLAAPAAVIMLQRLAG